MSEKYLKIFCYLSLFFAFFICLPLVYINRRVREETSLREVYVEVKRNNYLIEKQNKILEEISKRIGCFETVVKKNKEERAKWGIK